MNEKIAQLKLALGITDTGKDKLLEFALQAMEERVLAYIHHSVLPKGLEKTLVLMAAGYWKTAGLGDEEQAPGPVTGISRGDVSATFADPKSGAFALEAVDGFFGWRTALDGYRRLNRETTGGM